MTVDSTLFSVRSAAWRSEDRFGRGLRLACCALLLLLAGGCSRPFWRTQADFDAYNLVLEKTIDPRWDVPRITLESDPRARIYDPFDPDVTPLPPDDAAANQYMHWVDGMRGYKSWHTFGQQMTVENPQWLEQFPFLAQDYRIDWLESNDEDYTPPRVPTIENLTLEQAVELANINSREYQTTLEDTYIASLALTYARFQFNVRYLGLGGVQPTSNLTYLDQPSTLDSLAFNNRFGVSQLLPSGGQWIVELANNTLWLFSTPGQTNSSSILTYSLAQPLLTGAGRKVVLENLTLTERALLYALRDLARFRQEFFASIVGSQGGYLGIVSQIQQIDNTRFNLREIRIMIDKLKASYSQKPKAVFATLRKLPEGFVIPAELANRLEYNPQEHTLTWYGELLNNQEAMLLGLSEDTNYRKAVRLMAATYQMDVINQDLSQLLSREAQLVLQLRQQEASLQTSIDSYKLVLGIPNDFQLTLDKSLLKPFELIDPRINHLEDRLTKVIQNWDDINEDDPDPVRLRDLMLEVEELGSQFKSQALAIVEEDLEREEQNRPKRLSDLNSAADREQVLRNAARDRVLFAQCEDAREAVEQSLWNVETLLMQTRVLNIELPQAVRRKILGSLLDAREELLLIIQGLKVVQAGVRSEMITLQDFSLTMEDATALAVENRVDLMNTRAQVMDARRNMELVANRMQGVLNLVTRGDIRTSGGTNPFDFRADQSTFQAGFQFTAPLDQVLVRNNYRTSIIAYQRARRAYMLAEDQVKQDVRQEWRTLKLLQANFETSRQNLRFSAIQLDVTVENASLPSSQAISALPTVGAGTRSQTANQGLNILNALSTILNAQNILIQNWVQYETTRINFYRDIGIMEIDERGLWVDPVYQTPSVNSPTLTSEPADVVIPPEPTLINDRSTSEPPAGRKKLSAEDFFTAPSETDAPGDRGRIVPAGWFRLFPASERAGVNH
ncbi:MAG: TolC family protein [Planctomycetaceae bacterium]